MSQMVNVGRTGMQAITDLVVFSVFIYVCFAIVICPINKFHFLIKNAEKLYLMKSGEMTK